MEWQRGCGREIPQTSYRGKYGVNVRRVMAIILGHDVKDKQVTNICGNLRCVKAEHIRVLTKEQMVNLFMRQKRFSSPTRKIFNARKRKLTPSQMTEILLSTNTNVSLAKKYKMSENRISAIKRMSGYRGAASVFTWMP